MPATPYYIWQSQVENEHYSTVSGLLQLVISLECLIEITPDFLCPSMNDYSCLNLYNSPYANSVRFLPVIATYIY